MAWRGGEDDMPSIQDEYFDKIAALTEEEAKEMLNEIVVTLARASQDEKIQHDKIMELFNEL